jgi:hypothetical protein
MGGIKGFNITAASSLARKGLVRIVNDDATKTHIITLETRVADVEAAHAEALEMAAEMEAPCTAKCASGTVRYICRKTQHTGRHAWVLDIEAAHEEALAIELDRAHGEAIEMEEDRELEALNAREAAAFETTGELPEYLSPSQKDAVRRAFGRRAACPWTNVSNAGPCTRWAGHPGGCVPAQETGSVPPGGYPSPYAVATLATLIRRSNCVASPAGVEEPVEELKGRGFVADIPGLPLVALTESGKEFTRRWVLSSPEPVRVPVPSGRPDPCSSCNSTDRYHDC